MISMIKTVAVASLASSSVEAFNGMHRHQFFKPTNKINQHGFRLALNPGELPHWTQAAEYVLSTLPLTVGAVQFSPGGPGPKNVPIRMWMLFYEAYFNMMSRKKSPPMITTEFDEGYDDNMIDPPDHDDIDDLDQRNCIALYLSFISSFETIRAATHFGFEKFYEGLQTLQAEPEQIGMHLF